MKKQIITAGIVATMGAATIVGVGIAGAESSSTASTSSDPMSSLVSAIASKFNLSQSDVQKVFDEQRSTMEAQRETEIKTKVAQLVTDGKITQAQADLINAKRAEVKKEMEANRNSTTTKTRDEMKSDMDAKRTELETWAKNNGISTDYLRYVMGGGHGHSPDGSPADASSSSSSSSSTSS